MDNEMYGVFSQWKAAAYEWYVMHNHNDELENAGSGIDMQTQAGNSRS